MRLLRTTMLLLVTLMATGASIMGQTSTGEVNGAVTDPAGAFVEATTIKLINQATRIESMASTNKDGYFTFVNVVPGRYVLRVEAQGFKAAQTSPFEVGVS